MLATETRTLIDPMTCFEEAVKMVQNRNRTANGIYKKVLYPLVDSYQKAKKAHQQRRYRPNAGGPAMRLSQALWDFDYRHRFPTDKDLIAAEENSSGHLYHFYPKMAEGPFHISHAVAAFNQLRIEVFGLPDLPKADQPAADATPTYLCRVLLETDDVFLKHTSRNVQEDALVKQVMQATAMAHPQPDALTIATCKALQAYIRHLNCPDDFGLYLSARQHYEHLRALQYKHRVQLQNCGIRLNTAVNALCYQIRPIAQTG